MTFPDAAVQLYGTWIQLVKEVLCSLASRVVWLSQACCISWQNCAPGDSPSKMPRTLKWIWSVFEPAMNHAVGLHVIWVFYLLFLFTFWFEYPTEQHCDWTTGFPACKFSVCHWVVMELLRELIGLPPSKLTPQLPWGSMEMYMHKIFLILTVPIPTDPPTHPLLHVMGLKHRPPPRHLFISWTIFGRCEKKQQSPGSITICLSIFGQIIGLW